MEWEERGTKLVATAAALVLVAALAVALRFVSRGYLHRVLGLTDWVLALTLLFSVGNTISIAIHVSNGLGYDMHDLTLPQIESFFKVLWFSILVGTISNFLTKLSVLLLYLDIFVLPKMRTITGIVMAIVTAYGIYIIVSQIFFCVPIRAFWDKSVRGKCLPGSYKLFADAGLNITLDILIFCLPFPFLNFVSLPRKQKLWLHLVFALGFLVCIVSIVRLVVFARSFMSRGNEFDGGISVTYLTTIEMNVAIIAACMPTYKPLIKRFCPGLLTPSPEENPEGCQGHYGVLERPSHPPTISSAPSRQRQGPDTEELHVL